MRKTIVALVAALAMSLGCGAPAGAAPVVDCPLGAAPFSSKSPLVDILLSPAAKAVVDRHIPGLVGKLPPQFMGTQAPTFAAIITLDELLAMGGKDPAAMADQIGAIDRELRQLPVTRADRVLRCARYDEDRPAITVPKGKPRLLLFEKINGFKDTPSVTAAHQMFEALARENGWALVSTDKAGAFTPGMLARFDAVIWNNISGDVLTLPERKAFRTWLEHGGAFIGIHGSAGDPVYFWDWYADDLIGARFIGHPMPRQFQQSTVRIDDPASPIAAGLPREWPLTEEWYSFKTSPRQTGAHIIATLDESAYTPIFMGHSIAMGSDHPIVWTRCVGRGRMFYSAIGHRPEMYADERYRRMLINAVAWAVKPAECRTH